MGSIVCLSLSEVTTQKENSPRKKICSVIDRRKEKFIYIHFKWLGEGGDIGLVSRKHLSYSANKMQLAGFTGSTAAPAPEMLRLGGQGWGQCLLHRRPSASLCQRRLDAPSLHLQSTTILLISCLKPNLHSENS